MTLATLLNDAFVIRDDIWAVGTYENGSVIYKPQHSTLTPDIIQKHLDGEITVGIYTLSQKSMVSWIGWDIDGPDAEFYLQRLLDNLEDVIPLVEFSGGKGYHVILLLEDRMEGAGALSLATKIRDEAGLPKSGTTHVEVFPKQAKLTNDRPYGNLLKLPLGLHPKTKARSSFRSPLDFTQELDSITELSRRITKSQIEQLETGYLTQDTIIKKVCELIKDNWIEGYRHELSLHLSGYLGQKGWSQEDTWKLIERICKETNDEELDKRFNDIRDTYIKLARAEPVLGYQGLVQDLPVGILAGIRAIIEQRPTTDAIATIASIRLDKAPSFIKAEHVTIVIWDILNTHGKFIRTAEKLIYYYDAQTHLLESADEHNSFWAVRLWGQFRVSTADALGAQVKRNVWSMAMTEGVLTIPRKGSYWDGSEMFINFGGPEVYILDGRNIRMEYNGACGHLFIAKGRADPLDLANESDIDVFVALTDDLSFIRTKDCPATPAQQKQLLRSWIAANFFRTIMVTKPILVCLGVPGSGKTTAMRRLIKVLDGADNDVIALVPDKPDSFQTSIMEHPIICLDNIERAKAQWLIDDLNRVATGASIEIRRLYTHESMTMKVDCFVAITAVSLPFNNDALFSRILPLEMDQLESYLPENQLQSFITSNITELRVSLLHHLNSAIVSIKKNAALPVNASRLADYYSFCGQIREADFIQADLLAQGLRSLTHRQSAILSVDSPFVQTLQIWMEREPDTAAKPHTTQELFSILHTIALANKIKWEWTDAQRLSSHLRVIESALIEQFNANISKDLQTEDSHGHTIKRYSFPIF